MMSSVVGLTNNQGDVGSVDNMVFTEKLTASDIYFRLIKVILSSYVVSYSIHADIRVGQFKSPGQAFPEN